MFCFRFSLFCLFCFVFSGRALLSVFPQAQERTTFVSIRTITNTLYVFLTQDTATWQRRYVRLDEHGLPCLCFDQLYLHTKALHQDEHRLPRLCFVAGSHTSLFRSRPSRRTQAPPPSYLLCCVLDYFPPLFARWRRSLHPCPRKLPLSLCPFLFSLLTHLVSPCVSFPEESKL